MARVAEIIAEEWLNRQGYFTVRALKKVNEIDLLAYCPRTEDALHVEVNDSPNPQGFLGGSNAKAQMRESVEGFIQKKYKHENVVGLRKDMMPSRDPLRDWRFIVVYNVLRDEKEQTNILKEHGVGWVSFREILEDLKSGKGLDFETDSDAANLVVLLGPD
jgi:hypothetical protein